MDSASIRGSTCRCSASGGVPAAAASEQAATPSRGPALAILKARHAIQCKWSRRRARWCACSPQRAAAAAFWLAVRVRSDSTQRLWPRQSSDIAFIAHLCAAHWWLCTRCHFRPFRCYWYALRLARLRLRCDSCAIGRACCAPSVVHVMSCVLAQSHRLAVHGALDLART